LQRAKLDVAKRDTQEPRDVMSFSLQQPANLTIAAFGQFDQQVRLASGTLANDDGPRAQAFNTGFHSPG
jgi:hypothetical protein